MPQSEQSKAFIFSVNVNMLNELNTGKAIKQLFGRSVIVGLIHTPWTTHREPCAALNVSFLLGGKISS